MTASSRLLIMRHGEAGPGRVDCERRLTQNGEAEAARMARFLETRKLGPVVLYASPFVRAQQTARAVGDALGVSVTTLEGITPDDSPAKVNDWLLARPEGETLMLVSHMPLVGALCGRLVEGPQSQELGFPTAAIAELEADVWAAGCARLVRFTEPRQL
ncbi:phosphohistidine phosphatase SixA [Vreelandella sp. GE22]